MAAACPGARHLRVTALQCWARSGRTAWDPCAGRAGLRNRAAQKGEHTDQGPFERSSVSRRGDRGHLALTEPRLLSLALLTLRMRTARSCSSPWWRSGTHLSRVGTGLVRTEGARGGQSGDLCPVLCPGLSQHGSEPCGAVGNLAGLCPGASKGRAFCSRVFPGLSPCRVLLQSLLSRGRLLPFSSSPGGIFGAGFRFAWQGAVHPTAP